MIKRTFNRASFTVVENSFVRNARLSAKAKGILIYLLSLPDDWNLHLNELEIHFSDGKDSIKSGIRELKDMGYVEVEPQRTEDGRIHNWNYTIHEMPQAENPQVENPLVENPTLLNTNSTLSTNKTKYTSEIKEIIEYLNLVTDKHFKDNNVQTIRTLNARLKEGYTISDFKAVILNKSNQWKYETDMNQYLRPKTLFGNKFEAYLNEKGVNPSAFEKPSTYQTLD